ncbi:hypothetical protein ACI2KR_06825 [Pseudomonas luteola]
MSRDFLDQVKFLHNYEEFLDLVETIYRNADIYDVVSNHHFVVVGGQALAFWYARFILSEGRFDEFQSAYSEDLDFFGDPSAIEFCERQLGTRFQRPQNFDSTVNLAMLSYQIGNPQRNVIIDILHSVGGLIKEEILSGIELLPIRGMDVPVINPLLCLRSRVHNFYAPYKADKLNELNRIGLCVQFVNAFLTEKLESSGWSRDISKACESIFALCLSEEGRKLYCKNGMDLLEAIPVRPDLMHQAFIEKQLPRMAAHIDSERLRMHKHLLRFDKDFDGTHSFTP